jgi:regulator of protease activity HflC (stomatin/prohibitin superfamily)
LPISLFTLKLNKIERTYCYQKRRWKSIIGDVLIWLILSFIAIIIIILIPTMFYIVKQWETATLIRFGRIVKTVTGGIHIKMPLIDSLIRLDMRVQTFDLRGQSAITKDNISVKIDSVGFLKLEDARKLILGVEDYWSAIRSYSQTSLRNIVGEYSLDELLEKREAIAEKMKKIVDSYTKEWGVDIQKIELQDVVLPSDMQRAFAVQAEAERESRAVIIKANAELTASKTLMRAAQNMQKSPIALQLRILETLSDVSKDQSNTILFALPTETLKGAGFSGLAAAASINSSAARKRVKSE